jgi:hypothetical protein
MHVIIGLYFLPNVETLSGLSSKHLMWPKAMVPTLAKRCQTCLFWAKSCGTIIGKILKGLFVLCQSLWYHHLQNAVGTIYFWPKVVVPFLAKRCQCLLILAKSCGTILGNTLLELFVLGQTLWYHHHQTAVLAIFCPKVAVPFLAKRWQSFLFWANHYGTFITKMLSEPFIFGQKLWYHSWQKHCQSLLILATI